MVMETIPPAAVPPVRHFSRRRSLAYAALIVGAFFGLLELGLRVIGVGPAARPRLILRAIDVDIDFPFMRPDPDVFWAPKPGWRGEFLGQTVSINSAGLRGPEIARPKPPGRRRLACFGDSITFGYGVSDGEAYPALLNERLSARGVDVVNAGVTGYTSHQVRRLFPRVRSIAEPDVATFCIGWNDGTPRSLSDRQYARRLEAAMAVEGPLDRFYLFRAARRLYSRSAVPSGPRSSLQPRVGVEAYRENLRGVVAECRAHGVRPVLLALPHRVRRGEPPPRSVHAEALADLAAELGVPLLEAPPFTLDSTDASNEAYFIDSLHFSPAGHERAAEVIRAGLERLGY